MLTSEDYLFLRLISWDTHLMGIVHEDLVDLIRRKISQHENEVKGRLEQFGVQLAAIQDEKSRESNLLDAERQMRKEDKLRYEAEIMQMEDERRNPRS